MIFGHAALAVLARKTVFKPLSLPLLLLASYGPDVIDKMGMLLLGTPGKSIGHTLLTFVAVSTALAIALWCIRCKQSGLVWCAVTALWLSHLVFDLTGKTILLWPLYGTFPVVESYKLFHGLLEFYSGHCDHAVLALDLVCDVGALWAMLWPHHQHKMKAA